MEVQKKYPLSKLIVFFGVLDAILFIRFLGFAIEQPLILFKSAKNLSNISLILPFILEIFRTAFYISIPFLAYGLIRMKKWAFTLYYVQFPFRYIFILLSFGFITIISKFFDSNFIYKLLIYISMVLEFIRLIITIIVHEPNG